MEDSWIRGGSIGLWSVDWPVAGLPALIALKLLARDDNTRPQDAADLVSLAPLATPEDIGAARKLVHLIEDRNFHRGRDLPAELERLITE